MAKNNNGKESSVLVFLERRKTKEFVGRLIKFVDGKRANYEFEYNMPYLLKKNSIPLGPEFPLTKQKFKAERLFQTFEDRIPSRKNPAYVEYCQEGGVDPKENDPMILLPTIGKRGASSFVFEKPETDSSGFANEIASYRRRLNLTIREFSAAFGVSTVTLQKIEAGNPKSSEALRRLRIYVHFPEVAIWEIEQNKSKLHWKTYEAIKQALDMKMG